MIEPWLFGLLCVLLAVSVGITAREVYLTVRAPLNSVEKEATEALERASVEEDDLRYASGGEAQEDRQSSQRAHRAGRASGGVVAHGAPSTTAETADPALPMAAQSPMARVNAGSADRGEIGPWVARSLSWGRVPRASRAARAFHGFRRHWMLAASLGSLCGVVAAVSAYFAVDPYYEAVAVLRVQILDGSANRAVAQNDIAAIHGLSHGSMESKEVAGVMFAGAVQSPSIVDEDYLKVITQATEELTIEVASDQELVRIVVRGSDPQGVVSTANEAAESYVRYINGAQAVRRRRIITHLEERLDSLVEEEPAFQSIREGDSPLKVEGLDGRPRRGSESMQLLALQMAIADRIARLKLEIMEWEALPRLEMLRSAQTVTPINLGTRATLGVIGAIIGLCVPIASIVRWDAGAERINSVADVSAGLGLTVLGSIPRIPTRAVRELGSASKNRQTWHLRLTESIDGIAARLLHQANTKGTRVVLISSASGGEGKTTLATQLAMSLARNGRRTALVDFDLRRPAFDKVLGLPLEPGVSEVLRGQNDASEVIHPTGTENLDVVTAGRWDRLALTALANDAAGSFLDALRAKYDFVVVDSAPILPVADTRFVSQHVDTVILSVFRDISRSPKIMAAVETLDAFGVSNVDAVVTGPTDNLPDKDLRYALSRQQ